MPLPPHQRVSDLLHEIADLVQEADSYLAEGKYFKSSVKPLPKPKGQVGSVDQPFAADRVTNRLRKADERTGTDSMRRNMLRARRERKQRSRYQAGKLTKDKPRKTFGTRLRVR